MGLVRSVSSQPSPVGRLRPIVGEMRYTRLRLAAEEFRARFDGRTIWNVSSTAVGGGVAEMLHVLVGYVEDLGVDIRWLVIQGDPGFFAITKRLHNAIHGFGGLAGFDADDADHYQQVLTAHVADLAERVRSGDVVLLHDPQTAALARPLVEAGASVVWRCHIGTEVVNEVTEAAWAFLRPYVAPAHGWVFSRRAFVPPGFDQAKVAVIPPSIDPFSAKNQELSAESVHSILATIGLFDGTPAEPGRFTRSDGSVGKVVRPATVLADRLPGAGDDLVVQVSRWDHLKDMAGVMHGFARQVAGDRDCFLALVGPAMAGVTDDPEGVVVYEECVLQWRELPPALRSRIVLLTLPLADIDENAAMVNALQRHATIVVQKSLAEGFGLTVAEAMWKGRPVIGSAVGGINDQIVAGTGMLLPDPANLSAFGAAVRELLDAPEARSRMGAAAHSYVRDKFLGDVHLLRYAKLLSTLR
jgi:trehalose synthase